MMTGLEIRQALRAGASKMGDRQQAADTDATI
jgi:hypothetical protein